MCDQPMQEKAGRLKKVFLRKIRSGHDGETGPRFPYSACKFVLFFKKITLLDHDNKGKKASSVRTYTYNDWLKSYTYCHFFQCIETCILPVCHICGSSVFLFLRLHSAPHPDSLNPHRFPWLQATGSGLRWISIP